MAQNLAKRALETARRASRTLLSAERSDKRSLVALIDVLCCVAAVLLSFSIRLGYWQLFTGPVLIFLSFEIVCFLLIFALTGVYNNIFRFHGPYGLAQLALASLLLMLPTVMIFGVVSIPGVPRTVSVLFPLVFFAMVALNRILARFILVEFLGAPSSSRRVFIYGAGSAGRQLASSLEHEREYRLSGYFDDDPRLAWQRIEGVLIYPPSQLEATLKEHSADLLFFALPESCRSVRASVVERLQSTEIHVQTLPAIREIVNGQVSITDLREIAVTDLLSRDPVQPDGRLLASALVGRTVLVTGAGGSIGGELCRQIIRQRPKRIVLFEMTESALFAIDNELRELQAELGHECEIIAELGSLDNSATTLRAFERWMPQTVFHAAAYKHVPLVEQNVVAGVRNNVFGTLNCAKAAERVGVDRFILISTDKAVRPTSIMGASKRVCELILQALADNGSATRFSMVRFGNVLGSSGSVVPQFERQIAAGGPITVTHRDVTRFFMTIAEAAELVIQAGSMARGGEVYLLDMGEPVRIFDLAQTMVRLAGRSVRDVANPEGDIEIVEIGLRPGEKLYEELLIGSTAQPTSHERIRQAVEEKLSWAEVTVALDELQLLLNKGDGAAIREVLMRLAGVDGALPERGIIQPPENAAGLGEVGRTPPVSTDRVSADWV